MSEEQKESTSGDSIKYIGLANLYADAKKKEYNIPPREMKLLNVEEYMKDLMDPNKSIRITLQNDRDLKFEKSNAEQPIEKE